MYDETHDVKNSRDVDSPPKSESPNPPRFIPGTRTTSIDVKSPDETKHITKMAERRLSQHTIKKQPTQHSVQGTDSSDSSSDTDAVGRPMGGTLTSTVGVASITEHAPTPDAYDPRQYDSLDVPADVKELFQQISRYTPQNIELDYRLRPFIPKFIPAVGDIDALLKVVSPAECFDGSQLPQILGKLGLQILDEPSGAQSEPALLHMRLRATTTTPRGSAPPAAVARGPRDVDKWVLDVGALQSTRPAPAVMSTKPMPDIDTLMQEWSAPVERAFDTHGFPEPTLDCSLGQYAALVCALVDIPIAPPYGQRERLLALNAMFGLYSAVRNTNV